MRTLLPMLTLPARTNALGAFDIFLYRGPHLPAVVGLPIFAQAVYTDPASRTAQLTNSAELRMPDLPDTVVRARSKVAVPASSNIALPSVLPDTAALSLRLQ